VIDDADQQAYWTVERLRETKAEHEARVAVQTAGQSRRSRLVFVSAVLVVLVMTSTIAGLLAWHAQAASSPAPAVRAEMNLSSGVRNAVLPAPIDQVPAPPPYPGDAMSDHCGLWWQGWFPSQHAADEVPPTIAVAAPVRAGVTIVGASVHVFRSYQPPGVSFIMCLHGGGPIAGTLLTVDLSRPDVAPTVVADDGSDKPLSLPGAVIDVPAGQTQYVVVTPHGEPTFYEWSLTLRVIVDQRPATFTFGSREHPLLSWLGIVPTQAYDYDLQRHVWSQTA
jgi:hypothetical protein